MKKLILVFTVAVLALMAVPALAHEENAMETMRGKMNENGEHREMEKMKHMKRFMQPHVVRGEVESVDVAKGIIYLKGHEDNDKRPMILVNVAGTSTVLTQVQENGASSATLADFAAGDRIFAFVRKSKPAEGASEEAIKAARHQLNALIVTKMMPKPAPATAPAAVTPAN